MVFASAFHLLHVVNSFFVNRPHMRRVLENFLTTVRTCGEYLKSF